jgi:hypothetical protein
MKKLIKKKSQSGYNHKSINDYWTANKFLYSALRVLVVICESIFTLLTFVLAVIEFQNDKECEQEDGDHEPAEKIRLALIAIIFLHDYNIGRLLFEIVAKHKESLQKPNLAKFCFIDCYRCYSFIAYVFIYFVYFYYRDNCIKEMPNAVNWLLIEIIY